MILASVEEAETFVSRRSATARGILKITAPTSFSRMHIAPYLGRFMAKNPDLAINLALSDDFVDIVGESYDLAIRIAELADSSLVARKLAPVRRILCASPGYLSEHGTPASLEELENHNCLSHHTADPWRLVGPDGPAAHRPHGTLQTNSFEVVRSAILAGIGIGFRSTWDIGSELTDGRLVQILPEYEGSTNVGLYAIYPSRQFLPVKVRLFIDFLAELYGNEPYWDTGLTSPEFAEESSPAVASIRSIK